VLTENAPPLMFRFQILSTPSFGINRFPANTGEEWANFLLVACCSQELTKTSGTKPRQKGRRQTETKPRRLPARGEWAFSWHTKSDTEHGQSARSKPPSTRSS